MPAVEKDTSPFALVDEIVAALERRTDGKFLNASPSARRRILRNILGKRFQGCNVSRFPKP